MDNRISNFHSTALLLDGMIKGLENSGHHAPKYLEILKYEYQAKENDSDEVFFSMFCFWTGEKEIAQMQGVIATEAGYMYGREVVKVQYNTNDRISKDKSK